MKIEFLGHVGRLQTCHEETTDLRLENLAGLVEPTGLGHAEVTVGGVDAIGFHRHARKHACLLGYDLLADLDVTLQRWIEVVRDDDGADSTCVR